MMRASCAHLFWVDPSRSHDIISLSVIRCYSFVFAACHVYENIANWCKGDIFIKKQRLFKSYVLTATVNCGIANPFSPFKAVVIQGWADLNGRPVRKCKLFVCGDIRLLLSQIIRKDVVLIVADWPSKEALQIKSEARLDSADTTLVHKLAHCLEVNNLMRPHKAENRSKRTKACNEEHAQLSRCILFYRKCSLDALTQVYARFNLLAFYLSSALKLLRLSF